VIVRFRGELWEYGGEASWFFVSLPPEDSEDLKESVGRGARGFGSLRVRATVGATTWQTSVLPSKEGPYLLPVKRAVRVAEGLEPGDTVEIDLELIADAGPATRSGPSRGRA